MKLTIAFLLCIGLTFVLALPAKPKATTTTTTKKPEPEPDVDADADADADADVPDVPAETSGKVAPRVDEIVSKPAPVPVAVPGGDYKLPCGPHCYPECWLSWVKNQNTPPNTGTEVVASPPDATPALPKTGTKQKIPTVPAIKT